MFENCVRFTVSHAAVFMLGVSEASVNISSMICGLSQRLGNYIRASNKLMGLLDCTRNYASKA